MVYSDNQTRHFYVVAGSAGVAKKELAGTDKFRLMIHQGGNDASTASNITATTDIFDKKLIKDVRVSKPKGIGTRTWTFGISSVTANKEYRLYFYLENLLGFGMQDRWDRVASYTPSSTTASDFYIGIACDLYNKILAAGPLKNDFTISVTTSGDPVAITSGIPSDYTGTTATGIKIAEVAPTVTDWDVVMHNFPYKYNVTISSAYDTDNAAWIYQSAATVREAKPTVSYGHNGVVLYDMEHYFMRNRGDLYDVNPDFYTSIKNAQYINMGSDYACVDVHYAFSDDLGFTYHSDKDFTIVTTGTASNIDDIAASTAYVPGDVIKYNAKYWLVTKAFTTEASSPAIPANHADDLGTDVALADAYQIAALFE